MSLRLILGNSGSGKTHTLFEMITKLAEENPDKNYIVVVPEQFTLSTQHDLVRINPRRGILNIDVLSIQRLAHRIFEEVGCGSERGTLIDDMGKNLILRHLAEKYVDELPALGGSIKKLGYITEVKSVISEFMQYGIGMNEISNMINNADGHKGLQRKLMDIQVLYNAFREDIKNRYVTTEELLERASDITTQSRIIKNSVIAFDGFTGFTPVQYKFIESLMKNCLDMYITVVIDTSVKEDIYSVKGEHELFYLSKKTIRQITDVCNRTEQKKQPDILLEKRRLVQSQGDLESKSKSDIEEKEVENTAFEVIYNGDRISQNEELRHLEANLFRPGAQSCLYDSDDDQNDKKTDAISVVCAKDPKSEVEEIAKRMKFLVENKGLSYSDMAVITGDLDTYMNLCSRVFKKYEIPYFIDKTLPVLLNPLVEYVRAVLSILSDNYSYEAMFRYLKSSLVNNENITQDDVDRLENYVIARGIKGRSKWFETFTRRAKHMTPEELMRVDQTRKYIIEPFEALEAGIDYRKNAKYTVKQLCIALYTFTEKNNVNLLLKKLSEQLKSDDVSTYKEMEQIYDKYIALLEQLADLLGNEKITIKEFSELMDAGFEEIRTGILPEEYDYVQVGDITRSRLKPIKALFFAGVNDGIIPKSSSSGGILSDMDRELMLSGLDNVELAPTARDQAYTQQFYLYMLLSKPRDYLMISYSQISEEGKSIGPSYFIRTIVKLFPKIKIKYPDNSIETAIYNKENIYDELCRNAQNYINLKKLNRDYTEFQELFDMLACDSNYSKRLRDLVDASLSRGSFVRSDTIGRTVARALYGINITNSVTRLEAYASCAYSHFLSYGLKLDEREELEFTTADLGSVFHDVIMNYSKILVEKGYSWSAIEESQSFETLSEAVTRTLNDERYSSIYESERSFHLISRIKRISSKTIATLSEQLKNGDFVPSGFELGFSTQDNLDCLNIALSDDEKMKLMGRIDRIDVAEDDSNLYVKIIDYKSGKKAFDIVAVYEGLQLQLVLYLNAALELFKKNEEKRAAAEGDNVREVLPGAILYYHIDDPMIRIDTEMTPEEVNEKIKQSLKMNGLVNSDPEIYGLIDRDLKESPKSSIVPVKKNKDGSFEANSSVASTEEFEILRKYVDEKIKKMGIEMLGGNIAISPKDASGDNDKACKYCEYKGICQHHNDDSDEDNEDSEEIYLSGAKKLEKNRSYIALMQNEISGEDN